MKRGITPRSKMHRSLPPEMIVAAFSLVARAFDRRDRNGQIIERIIAYAKRFRWESLASANINATHAAIAVSHFGHYYHRLSPLVFPLFHRLPPFARSADRR